MNKPKTITQSKLIRELAQGKSYAEIASSFGVSKNALYHHFKRMRKQGLEPTDVNALRRHILGPSAKPLRLGEIPQQCLTPLQERILRLIDNGKEMEEIRHSVNMGYQTLRNTACQGFARIGISRLRTPKRIWKAQLRKYFATLDESPFGVTMDDPFFN